VSTLVKWAGGIPRRLNALADSALFEAHMAGRVSATAGDVERAALELELPSPEALEPRRAPGAPGARDARVATSDLTKPAAPAVVQSRAALTPEPSPLALATPDLEAVFAEEDAPLELEEVVAIGTDPLTGSNEADGAGPFAPENLAPETAADATVALFGEAEDLSAPSDDSHGDLDDLFADLVQE
jgi:hypothetical protein